MAGGRAGKVLATTHVSIIKLYPVTVRSCSLPVPVPLPGL